MNHNDYEIIYPNDISRQLYEVDDRVAFFKSDYFKNYFIKQIDMLSKEEKVPIISCDIFDTILLRNNKSEPYRFYEIANRIKKELSLKHTKYDVLHARYLGTEISYAASPIVHGCREGSLYDIHRVLLNALKLDVEHFVDTSIKAELDYEKENLILNEGLWNLLQELQTLKKIEIIFISDTYKHWEHIDTLINTFIPNYKNYVKKYYSSADVTISKHSGHIFDRVQQEFNVVPNQFLHIGDNLHSDYQIPKKKGWNAMFLPIPKAQQEKIRENLIAFKKQLDDDKINIKLVNRLFGGQ